MYGKPKNDVYKNSKWSTSEKSSRRNDIDLNSESDYEDKSEQSYEKPISYNDYFTKLNSTINDIKTEVKNPHKVNEKIDVILEYVKSIDSDTKNAIELLGRGQQVCLNTHANVLDSLPLQACHCEELKHLIGKLPEEITKLNVLQGNLDKVDEDDLSGIIRESYRLSLLNNKSRLKMDVLPLKLETVVTDIESLHHHVNVLTNLQHTTNLLLNKLIMDHEGLKTANTLLHKKLDSLTNVNSTNVNSTYVCPVPLAVNTVTQDVHSTVPSEVDNIVEEDSNDDSDSDGKEIDIVKEQDIEIKEDVEEKVKYIDLFNTVDINSVEVKVESNIPTDFEPDKPVEDTDIEKIATVIEPVKEHEGDIGSKYYKITDKPIRDGPLAPKSIRSVPIKQKPKKK